MLSGTFLPFVRFWAPEHVYPHTDPTTGHLDLKSYPSQIRSDALVSYANKTLLDFRPQNGAPWQDELRRMARILVPEVLALYSCATTLVLCFDSAEPTPLRSIHPLVTLSRDMAAAGHPAPGAGAAVALDFAGGTVAKGQTMLGLMTDPQRCASFYAALLPALAENCLLPEGMRVIIDGLADAEPLVLYAENGQRRLGVYGGERHASGPRDALDRIGGWAAQLDGSVMVECDLADAALKLLACSELRLLSGADSGRRLWLAHRRSGGRMELPPAESGYSKFVHSEPHEYIDIYGAARQLRRAYFNGVWPMYEGVRLPTCSTPIVPVLALVYYAFCGEGRMAVRASTFAQIVATAVAQASSYYRAVLVIQPPSGAFRVAIRTAAFEKFYSELAITSDYETHPHQAVAARTAVLLHRLYNAHLPGQELVAAQILERDELDDQLSKWGFRARPDGAAVPDRNVRLRDLYLFEPLVSVPSGSESAAPKTLKSQ